MEYFYYRLYVKIGRDDFGQCVMKLKGSLDDNISIVRFILLFKTHFKLFRIYEFESISEDEYNSTIETVGTIL